MHRKTPWGKFEQNLGLFHPLVDHCLDVATVFRALLERPNLARGLAKLSVAAKERLAVIAFLHDFGKCNRGFQAKADPQARETAGHVMEALAFLHDGDPNIWPPAWRDLLSELSRWFASEEQAMQMLIASISHHGRPISQSDIERWVVDPAHTHHLQLWQPSAGYDPLAALDHLAQVARAAFPAAFEDGIPPIDATAELQHRFAGLVMLADWIGSDTQFFPFRQSHEEDRLTLARQAAQRALAAIGLAAPEPRQPKAFTDVFPFTPTPLQEALASQLEVGESTRLLLVESDTGSGKTEAALAWWMRLYAEGQVDGLYFALPTRVAARELYTRVLQAVERAFEPDQRPRPVLLAAPGYVRIDGEPLLPDPSGALWDDDARAQWRERFWSAERPKRFLAAPVAVGTIDQALLSVLQVKHSLMRSVCLDRHLLVVDEVHASDPYMRELLKELLRGHLARGGWALLLSATLGETSAAAFFGREPAPLASAIARAYPLISARDKTWPMPPRASAALPRSLLPSWTRMRR
jgi:CRISPR-associated endonuclease/helicase Cas3